MHSLFRIKDQGGKNAMHNSHGGLGKRNFPFLF